MKRVLLFLAITGLTTVLASGQKKETRAVSGFTGIDASSAFDITVTKGGTESLVIEADDDIMPLVRSEVRNGVLHLYLDNHRQIRNIKTLKASVVMKNLDKAVLSGASKLTANDLFTPDKFKGDCSGASNLTVNVNTGELSISASGACKIQLKANVTGNAKFDVSGASKIQGELRAENVKFDSSGVSSLELTGSANDLKIDVSGTSNIKAGDFSVKTATVESSGTSKITLNVANALNVNSSGASSVEYRGSPAIQANTGGTSKIRKI
jgi:hypothetical protein